MALKTRKVKYLVQGMIGVVIIKVTNLHTACVLYLYFLHSQMWNYLLSYVISGENTKYIFFI